MHTLQDLKKVDRFLAEMDTELSIMHKQLVNYIESFFPREAAPDPIKYTYHRVDIKGYTYGYKKWYEDSMNHTEYLGPCGISDEAYGKFKETEKKFKKLLKAKLQGQRVLTGMLLKWKEYLKINR